MNLKPYTPAKPVERDGSEKIELIRLNSNENRHGCSPIVIEAVQQLNQDFSYYPDGLATELTNRLADNLKVSTAQIILGAGGDEVIQIISRSVLTAGDNIVQADLTFSQYSLHAVIEGAEIRNVPLVEGTHDLAGMAAAADDRTKIIWICNPNNPTGTYVNASELNSFMEKISPNTLVVVDEAYFEYVSASDFPNTIELIEAYKNLLVLRTFSKIYGLASFRIGYGIANEELISRLNIVRLPYNTARFSQVAACAALEDMEFVKYSYEQNKLGLTQLEEFFDKENIKYYKSQANFIYIVVNNSEEIVKLLENKGFIVRKFLEGIRITVGTQKDTQLLIQSMQNIFVNQ
jgi:histidinol-phosphate aminotransferase